MEIMEYIVGDALVMIPALWILGAIIKRIEKIPDKYIPLLLLPVGVLGACALMGWSVQAVIQGVLVTGAAVYGNQLVKQLDRQTRADDPGTEE